MAFVDWSMRGPEIGNCNCDWGCPCQFNAPPTYGNCSGMLAMRIDEGHFGDVDLGGLAFCMMFTWPKAIHNGGGESLAVMSDHATPAQREALIAILAGRETAPGATLFNVFATTIVKVHPPQFAPIEFAIDIDGGTGNLRIPGVIETSIEPIRNPVTGEAHRVRIVLPSGFQYREAEFASGRTLAVGAVRQAFQKSHADLAMINLSTRGAA
jgi:hypothetical protein